MRQPCRTSRGGATTTSSASDRRLQRRYFNPRTAAPAADAIPAARPFSEAAGRIAALAFYIRMARASAPRSVLRARAATDRRGGGHDPPGHAWVGLRRDPPQAHTPRQARPICALPPCCLAGVAGRNGTLVGVTATPTRGARDLCQRSTPAPVVSRQRIRASAYKGAMPKRGYGTGSLYEKSGSYYGRWRTATVGYLNRKVGAVRTPASSEGLTRSQAERQFRKLQEAEELTPRPSASARSLTVDELASSLRERLELRGVRKSYSENCEYMQRVHVTPLLGDRKAAELDRGDIEAFGRACSSESYHQRACATSSASCTPSSSTASTGAGCARTPCGVRRSPGDDVAGRTSICSSSASPSSRR